MSHAQVADLYLGRTQSGVITDLPESAPQRAEFYKKVADREPAQMKALWARLVFTGRGQPPKEVADSASVKKVVAADAKALGYVDASAVDGSVKVLLTLK